MNKIKIIFFSTVWNKEEVYYCDSYKEAIRSCYVASQRGLRMINYFEVPTFNFEKAFNFGIEAIHTFIYQHNGLTYFSINDWDCDSRFTSGAKSSIYFIDKNGNYDKPMPSVLSLIRVR